MKRRNKKRLRKKSLRLKDSHSWKAPDGYKILVADRGAVSFNIPLSWHFEQVEPIELYDQPPPDDNARLSVSFWRLPPGIDWSGLPLVPMLADATKDNDEKTLARGEIVTVAREDLELVWTEHRFLDPEEQREAFSRIAIARGWDVQVLLTLDFWVDDSEKILPVWEEVLRSLQLGRHIEDPTKGMVLH